jgi:hypothetical protein
MKDDDRRPRGGANSAEPPDASPDATALEDRFRVAAVVRHGLVYWNASTGPPGCRREFDKISSADVIAGEVPAARWRSRSLQYLLAAFFAVTGPVLAIGQPDTKLIGTGAVGPAEQGWSVALSADGTTAT